MTAVIGAGADQVRGLCRGTAARLPGGMSAWRSIEDRKPHAMKAPKRNAGVQSDRQ